MNKKMVVALVSLPMMVLLATSAKADDDKTGSELVTCFHHADRHMHTTCTEDDSVLSHLMECDGSAFVAVTCRTAYRGGWTNTLYRMTSEMYMKCENYTSPSGTKKARISYKVLDVKDDKTPEPCEMESWQIFKK